MPPTAVETIKTDSAHLRGELASELTEDGDTFGADSTHLLKFHGIYQQDDRDRRRELTVNGQSPDHSCMVRCSVPGGRLRADQWATIDDLADEVGDGSLRLTTRQGVQYHFIRKGDLKELIGTLNRRLVTTYAACGDVVRNVMVSPIPADDVLATRLQALSAALVGRFRPRSDAYWELWLDGERTVSAGPLSDGDEIEPLYGATYLPRKFKIGLTAAGDNSVDIYTHDVGVVLLPGPDGRDGGVILVGGGLGRTAKDPTTFPRLAEPFAWVPEEEIPEVLEAIVATYRDHGNREDRKHARLKYLVHDRGVAWLRGEVEERSGLALAEPLPLPGWDRTRDYLGWHQQPDGTWYVGLPVPGGRLRRDDSSEVRGAVRAVLGTYADEIRLTPHQDLLLCGIADGDRPAVNAILRDHGVRTAEQLSLTALSSMACPALPTCGQALGEAERILPELTGMIDKLLADRGLNDLRIETRVTGCPNGCARPYVAELGIVGRTKTAYDLWIGGDPAGTRLARPLIESVPLARLDEVLGVLLDRYRISHLDGEGFGAWADRLGPDTLAETLPDVSRRARS